MLDYCGFLSLEDARHARDLLRPRRIQSEIVIRDASESGPAHRSGEEYWLRVPARSFPQAAEVLGHDAAEGSESVQTGTFACSECGESVGEDESFCAHCGARFDE